jgi:hypothetical protein
VRTENRWRAIQRRKMKAQGIRPLIGRKYGASRSLSWWMYRIGFLVLRARGSRSNSEVHQKEFGVTQATIRKPWHAINFKTAKPFWKKEMLRVFHVIQVLDRR